MTPSTQYIVQLDVENREGEVREVALDDIVQVSVDDDGDCVLTTDDGTVMIYPAGSWDGLLVAVRPS